MPAPDSQRDRLLAQFRHGTPRQEETTFDDERDMTAVAVSDGEAYEAFKPVDRRQLSLYVRPASEPLQWVKYGYMTQVVADSSGTRLDIIFPFLVVTLTGRNLLEVGDAIANERCDFVQQFDDHRWPMPNDSSAPFIESIVYASNIDERAGRERGLDLAG